ncbi:MAG: hypothetical protein M1825_000661 [Sarcosagium campestre]|nr:MAG: hypothetical protein M1825_000661 [Sarcosagium campestre]
MTSLGFENYAEALKIYLSKYRETQSARGETQNRPGSGFGSGGPVGGSSGPSEPPSTAPFNERSEGAANSVLSPQQVEQHDAGTYGYPPVVDGNHNGAGGAPYS